MDTFIVILGLITLGVTLLDSMFGILVMPIVGIVIIIGIIRLNKENSNKKDAIAAIVMSGLAVGKLVISAINFENTESVVLLIFFLIFVVFITWTTIYFKKHPEAKHRKNYQTPFYVRHLAGLELNDNALCLLHYTKERIAISYVQNNKVLKKFQIKTQQVVLVEEDAIVEKRLVSGDSTGNALLGGLLFGGVGAIVGATTGNNIKDVKQDIDVIKIKYTSKSNEEKMILLLCEDKYSYKKFIKTYNREILNVDKKGIENIEL